VQETAYSGHKPANSAVAVCNPVTGYNCVVILLWNGLERDTTFLKRQIVLDYQQLGNQTIGLEQGSPNFLVGGPLKPLYNSSGAGHLT